LGKSFIYRRKSSGPRTEPCAAPCLTFTQLETSLLVTLSLYTAALKYQLSR
jgi:hypothetical protein